MLRALAAPVFTLADVMDLTVDKLYGGPGYPAERGPGQWGITWKGGHLEANRCSKRCSTKVPDMSIQIYLEPLTKVSNPYPAFFLFLQRTNE